MSDISIKTCYNEEIRRYKGARGYDSLNAFVKSTYKLSNFRLTYIDEDEDELTIDAQELPTTIDTYRQLGKTLKINVVVIKQKSLPQTHASIKKPQIGQYAQ